MRPAIISNFSRFSFNNTSFPYILFSAEPKSCSELDTTAFRSACWFILRATDQGRLFHSRHESFRGTDFQGEFSAQLFSKCENGSFRRSGTPRPVGCAWGHDPLRCLPLQTREKDTSRHQVPGSLSEGRCHRRLPAGSAVALGPSPLVCWDRSLPEQGWQAFPLRLTKQGASQAVSPLEYHKNLPKG